MPNFSSTWSQAKGLVELWVTREACLVGYQRASCARPIVAEGRGSNGCSSSGASTVWSSQDESHKSYYHHANCKLTSMPKHLPGKPLLEALARYRCQVCYKTLSGTMALEGHHEGAHHTSSSCSGRAAHLSLILRTNKYVLSHKRI